MIIEIFQWFESPLFVSPVVLVNLFYLSFLNDFLNQSKNLMNTDRDTLYQVLKKKKPLHSFMERMINSHVNVFLESSPSTSGPIVKIWKFCEVSMCYLGYSILRFWYLADYQLVFVMNFLVSLGTCTCVSQRKAWKEEMNEEEKPLDRYEISQNSTQRVNLNYSNRTFWYGYWLSINVLLLFVLL